MYRLEDCIAFVTQRGSRELSDEMEKRLNVHGITKTQWMILYYIDISLSITQREVSDLLGIKESSVVRQLDKMELNGWIVRNPNKEDKRKKMLELTKSGYDILKDMEVIVIQFKNDVTSSIDEGELEVFRNVLEKMLINIRQ